ncbi:MAG: S1 RNA-binding domain-containing protein [Deltaproteobacteria bacterium]|nr:MAG: S1 RNA-binding domain-containing protein [Deltaproteobacteria bacterium]
MHGSTTGARPTPEAADQLAPERLADDVAEAVGLDRTAVRTVLEILAEGVHPVYVARHRPDRVPELGPNQIEAIARAAAAKGRLEIRRRAMAAELASAGLEGPRVEAWLAETTSPAEFDDLREAMRRKRKGPARDAAQVGLTELADRIWARGARLGPLRRRKRAARDEGASASSPAEVAHADAPGDPSASDRGAEGGRAPEAPAPEASVPPSTEVVGGAGPESSAVPQGATGADEAAPRASIEAGDLEALAARYVRGPVADVAAALAGARALCRDDLAKIPELRRAMRRAWFEHGVLRAEARAEPEAPQKPQDAADGGEGTRGPEADAEASKAAATPAEPDAAASSPVASEDTPDPSVAVGDTPSSAERDVPGGGPGTAPETVPSDPPERQAASAAVPEEAADAPANVPESDGPAGKPPAASPGRAARKGAAEQRRASKSKKARARRAAKIAAIAAQGLLDKDLPLAKLEAHQILTLWHGVRHGWIELRLEAPMDVLVACGRKVLGLDGMDAEASALLEGALEEALAAELGRSLRAGIRRDLKDRADREMVGRFAAALRPLLLAPALGPAPVLGVVPGFSQGCRLVVVGGDGMPVFEETVHPLAPKLQVPQTKTRLREIVAEHGVAAVAVGAGRGGRDVVRLAREAFADVEGPERPMVVEVPDDAAGLYATSKTGRSEFPEADGAYRRAVALARRLQDPLAELARVDLRHLGLGAHQHDVDAHLLGEALDETFVTCLHLAGLEVNRAPASLLERLNGLGHALAGALVAHRTAHGPFRTRAGLLDVPGLAGRAFVLSAGFLWLEAGEHPLDGTFVHPEWYALVAQMARKAGHPLADVVGDPSKAREVAAAGEAFLGQPSASGEPLGPRMLSEIAAQLEQPRRGAPARLRDVYFEPARRGYDEVAPGDELEGVITHVATFGAFVDVGLPTDALLHVSEISDEFVADPFASVAVGEKVRVRVLSVDEKRQRVAVTRKTRSQRHRAGRDGRGEAPGKRRGRRRKDGGARPAEGKRQGRKRGGPRPGGRKHRRDEDRPLNFRMDLGALAGLLGDGDGED